MGVVNMMIVIPMLIQTLTFGWVYKHVLGESPTNALVFAGVFLFIAGLLIQTIDTKKDADPLVQERLVGSGVNG